MSKILETSLVVIKETKFDKIRKIIYQIFFQEEYLLDMELKNIIKINRPNPEKIVIPREMVKK
ncbi:MAG: hypothetical protein ACI4VH_01530 [Clostridia bacterium]